MSQYLSHLANLAFNHVDVVQPRLTSRFEHQDAASAPNLMEQEIQREVPVAQSRQDHQEPAQQERLSQQSQPALQPIIEHIYPTEIRVQEAPVVKPQSLQTQAPATPIIAATHVPAAAISSPVAMATSTIVERHIERISERTPPRGEDHGKITASARAYRQEQPLAIHESVERVTIKEGTPDIPSGKKSEATSDAVKPVSIRVQPLLIEPVLPPATTYPTLLRAEVDVTPAPTIQVTIGRIEIRASQTNSPVPSKPRPSSGMTLDDYLKQRNGDKP
jgi:hypothetical protein